MEVTKVRFEAFKSLYGVTCDLAHFTVLTGPNGAGKSNLVDALNFLGEVYADGIEFAVGRAGGYDNIAHRRTRRARRPIAIAVEAVLDSEDLERALHRFSIRMSQDSEEPIPDDFTLTFRHEFSIGTASRSLLSDFEIRSEYIEIADATGEAIVRIARGGEGVSVQARPRKLRPRLRELLEPFINRSFVDYIKGRQLPATALFSEIFFYGGLFTEVSRALAGTRVFQLSPYQCRSSGVPTPNASLERHGENLPAAADHLRRNDESAWTRVQEAMRAIMPELAGIEVVYTEDRRLALQFRERGVGRPWNTNEVSDGTIQALALFIALHDNRYPLLVVEEPENSVHPWILRQFLDACMKASTKQIVVTTHSPILLNYVDPASVRLMTIANGRSSLYSLLEASEDLQGLVLSGELSVFDLYDSGSLWQALPRGFRPDTAALPGRSEVESEGA